jgi:osmoprotectant transport system permease protein
MLAAQRRAVHWRHLHGELPNTNADLEEAPMNDLLDGLSWLTTADNWWGEGGIVNRTLEHLWYSFLATGAAVVIGFPIGLFVGHTGKGRFIASNLTGLWRAIPTIGVVTLLYEWRPLSVWPVLAALTVLALPPVILNTVAGIDSVDPEIRDAARGMGLTGWQALWQVEVPNGLPLILAGIRSAANQVIATATVAGYVGLGTLGLYIFTGYSSQRYNIVYGATVAVIVLVLLVEAGFAVLQRTIVSPGVRQRAARGRVRSATATVPVVLEPGGTR